MSNQLQVIGTALFAVAVIHAFVASPIHRASLRFPSGSVGRFALHWLGEAEVVFGFWAVVLLLAMAIFDGFASATAYARSRDFTEPLFVLAAIAIAGSRPVLAFARGLIHQIAVLLPFESAFYFVCLVIGPLIGSFITEPAAITVTALLLRPLFGRKSATSRFRYLTLAVLFVNVSIGGTLTNFAAPPVLMVAKVWNWSTADVFLMFGWKSALAVVANALAASWFLRDELRGGHAEDPDPRGRVPGWMIATTLAILAVAVLGSHYPWVFMGALVVFVALAAATPNINEKPRIKEGALVACFLGGLVVLGGLQGWWLDPVLRSLSAGSLFVGAAGLTAILDNAAITYLGAQIPGLSEALRYAIVAGAVAGGGLTLIANAPNPAGHAILRGSFGGSGASPLPLLLYALGPTAVAMAMLWLL